MNSQKSIVGSLESVYINKFLGYVLTGWAFSDADPYAKVEIRVVTEGQTVAAALARLFHPTLAAEGRGAGFYGFSLLLPAVHAPVSNPRIYHVFGNGQLIDSVGLQPLDPAIAPGGMLWTKPEDQPVDILGDVALLAGGGVFDGQWYLSAYPDVAEWCTETGQPPYYHYQMMGRSQGLLPHVPINVNWYTERYGVFIGKMSEIVARSPLDHYYLAGGILGFDAVPGFDETSYLAINGDVRALVEARELISGYSHYLMFGAIEGRATAPWCSLPRLATQDLMLTRELVAMVTEISVGALLSNAAGRDWATLHAHSFVLDSGPWHFAEALYQAHRLDASGAISARHWREHGFIEDISGTVPRIAGYCEHRYLVANPDIAEAVGKRQIPSGYHHFLCFGHEEGRNGGVASSEPPVRLISTAALLARLNEIKDWPKISIIMPVYDTPERWLRATIESVLGQIYPYWELCIADDNSPHPRVQEVLQEFAVRDSRIRITTLPINQGIAGASNAALMLASGPWIALLDHDDQLTPDALFEIALAVLNHAPDAVYSDEDKMSVEGRLFDATFKPDWSPEFLTSTMYIGHLTAYRTAIVRKIGGFRSDFDGTQDYDLALRVAQVTNRFIHIPKILYHWVAIPGSTADVLSAKSYAIERQKKAITEFVEKNAKTSFEVMPHYSTGNWRVVYSPPSPPLLSVLSYQVLDVWEISSDFKLIF